MMAEDLIEEIFHIEQVSFTDIYQIDCETPIRCFKDNFTIEYSSI